MNNAFLSIFPRPPTPTHILSFPNFLPLWLHRWKCLKQDWIYCVWFWTLNEKRKDIHLETTIHCLLPCSLPPFFVGCPPCSGAQGSGEPACRKQACEGPLWERSARCSLLGPADVRAKKHTLRPEIYVIKLLPSPALTDKQPNSPSCVPSLTAVPQLSNCVYKVYSLLIWAQTLGQSYKIFYWFSLHPKGSSRPWHEPDSLTSAPHWTTVSPGQNDSQGSQQRNRFQQVFAKGVRSQLTPENHRHTRKGEEQELVAKCWPRWGQVGSLTPHGQVQPSQVWVFGWQCPTSTPAAHLCNLTRSFFIHPHILSLSWVW